MVGGSCADGFGSDCLKGAKEAVQAASSGGGE